MEVTLVATEDLEDLVSEAVPEGFERLSALNIRFISPKGEELQPQARVRISIRTPLAEDTEDSMLIRIDREGNVTVVDQEDPEAGDEIIFEIGPDETELMPAEAGVETETEPVEEIGILPNPVQTAAPAEPDVLPEEPASLPVTEEKTADN